MQFRRTAFVPGGNRRTCEACGASVHGPAELYEYVDSLPLPPIAKILVCYGCRIQCTLDQEVRSFKDWKVSRDSES